MRITEGFLPVDGHRVWWKRVDPPAGSPVASATPVLLLHGGPGAGHDYLEPLEGLAVDRPVIFWDQLGCGRSDQPDDLSLWTIARFRREVDVVRAGLGLDRIHLLGQSWGGWLGIEYMVHRPAGIVGLVLASTSASIAQFMAEAEKLKAQLPPDVYATMQRCEAVQAWTDPDYLAAVDLFYRRHLCRLDPWPDALMRSVANLDGNAVYATINGPNEFIVTGELRTWDRIADLKNITCPTLVTVGGHDEVPLACSETIRDGIAGSELVVFHDSGHCAHLEETTRYLDVVRGFLRRVDAGVG